ncbi:MULTISPECIES: rhodanese-like domain-containing protein [unclassified Haladaptatus]|uniref:rhodanese-like domain-containing protein n=1 Tax=unclassified Haladaptatus TaxID=2622732 RepID=UPI00209C65E5|nr:MULTISPECIES: rhodanese-like domain-containing protein [unclassified Haladaptatus]MCO8243297.1 rhodanese-like domain-containing protein [Haladaptatus sp. AB643]MCO8253008.1 rhodanese-like domain-containing protein [Haladaptatus sp. AB618]
MSKIRPDELDDRLDADDAPYVLDIRPRKAFQSDHIDGSRNIPVYDDLRGGDEDALRSRLDKIPQDSPIVTVCKMGVVAKRATGILDEEGYEVSTLAGGMSGWRGYQAGSLGYRLRSVLWRLF